MTHRTTTRATLRRLFVQPYNVGCGSRFGRFARLCLAAINHPAGVVTRHLCRKRLWQVVRRTLSQLLPQNQRARRPT